MKDSRVDAYIKNAPDYARPILEKIRAAVHKADPRIGEDIKWGNPTFMHNGIVAGMGAFKHHVAWGFWNAASMKDPEKLFGTERKKSPYALKATSVKDLPPARVLNAYIKEAVQLNESGVKRSAKKAVRAPLEPPADFLAALRRKRKALATFEGFPPSRRREYVEWITEAKRDATRSTRIATAVEWLAEGKPRNWKYMKTW
ncbi:MAG: YdeI/OmpD-associated family protein [Planctomycetota bacterium]|jgi:uncharacterized protein YdeI (YjbR/CyaY-like superfamily)